MKVTTHAFTHIGQRDENQDRHRILRSPDGSACLVVVADGLGGHRGGALAAQTVVETAERLWGSCVDRPASEEFLRSLALECHEAVNAAGDKPRLEPRTTVAALLIEESGVTSLHAGDSRVMQFSDNKLTNRTFDHSIGQLSVLRGRITESELATHPDQKKLFSHLGGGGSPELEVNRWKLARGRRFIVCSDGFWEVFAPTEVPRLFESGDPEREVKARFVKKLEELEDHDNTTVVMVDIDHGLSTGWYWLALATVSLAGLVTALVPHGELRSGQPSLRQSADTTPISEALEGSSIGTSEAGGESRADSTAQTLGEGREQIGLPPGTSRTEGSVAEGVPAETGHENTTQGTESPKDEGIDPTVPPTQLDRVAFRFEIGLAPDGSVSQAVADELRKRRLIGPEDALRQRGPENTLNGNTLIRLSQEHRGIPVDAAEVVATVNGERLVAVQGRIASGIDLPRSRSPDYGDTISRAEQLLGVDIKPQDSGAIVIFRDQVQRDRVVWSGLVLIDRGQEYVLFDPESGEILRRVPANVRLPAAVEE